MWTEAIRAIPLPVTLLVGSPDQTPSYHLKPMSDLYRVDKQSFRRPAMPGDDHLRFVPSMTNKPLGTLSGDTGTKVRRIEFTRSSETTGGRLLLFNAPDPLAEAEQSPAIWTPIAAPRLPDHAQAVRWLVEVAGLPADRVGDLVGASRVRVQQWKMGDPIRGEHLRRLMETRDILHRAMRQRTLKDELAAWLVTPDPHEGVSPEQLLKQGDFERARLLAVLSPSAIEPMPTWAKRPVAEAWRGALNQRERPGEFLDE